jgi:hypothetical protein
MTTISRRHYALSVCAAAAILAGCGGSAQSPNPTAQTLLGSTGTVDRSASPSIVSSNHSSNRPDSAGAIVDPRSRKASKDAIQFGGARAWSEGES